MDVTIKVSEEFERQAKRFAKKYKTFVDDFASFLTSIKENPYQGVDLGGGKRKVRMAVSSKGKGKSGGLRVITFNIQTIDCDSVLVNLITLYDKKEIFLRADEYDFLSHESYVNCAQPFKSRLDFLITSGQLTQEEINLYFN